MNITRIFEYTKQYIKRNKPLFIATLVVISLTILILNLFTSISFVTYQLSVQIQKQQKASVLFEPLTPKEEVLSLANEIKQLPGVLDIEITDSAQLKEESLDSLGIESEEFSTTTKEEKENLLPILRVQLDPNKEHKQVISLLKTEQRSNPKIIRVIYFEEVADRINVISNTLKLVGLSIIGILALISSYLIYLTMQFSVHSLEDEIKTMKLVGATEHQVVMPFALQGAIIGAMGALLSWSITAAVIIPLFKVPALGPIKRLLESLIGHLQLGESLSINTFIYLLITEIIAIALVTFIISYVATKKTFKKIL